MGKVSTASSPELGAREGARLSVAGDSRHLSTAVACLAAAYSLSKRESCVVRLAAAGLEDKEIAFAIDCAVPTIQTYWHRVYRKMGCRSKRLIIWETWRRYFAASDEADRGDDHGPI
jgi:DNA-binding NarL/FixJ family response regulator